MIDQMSEKCVFTAASLLDPLSVPLREESLGDGAKLCRGDACIRLQHSACLIRNASRSEWGWGGVQRSMYKPYDSYPRFEIHGDNYACGEKTLIRRHLVGADYG